MADRTVTITLNAGTHTLSLSSDPMTVDPSDTLCWKCNGGEYAVLFHNDRSPFASGKKVHGAHKGNKTQKLKIRGLTTGEQGFPVTDPDDGATFKYSVSVLDPGSGQLVTLDPDVVIDDPGGGGPP